jgi:TolB-like protein
MSLFEELKRRNVFRVAIAYVLLGWAVLQGADFLLDLAEAPQWVIRVFAIAGLVGFPFAVFFSWAYELTPEGLKRDAEVQQSQSITAQTGRKLNGVIIALLVLVIVLMGAERLFLERDESASGQHTAQSETAEQSIQSVAVLPFVDMSPEGDQAYFGDGIAEEVLNELTRLEGLRVASRTSSFAYREGADTRVIAEALNVATVLEGSVRKNGGQIRVTAQLINAADGYHLWSKTFDRELTDIFVIQDEIAEAVAGALGVRMKVGDVNAFAGAGTTIVDAYEAYLRGMNTPLFPTAQSNERISLFERAIELDPEYAAAWAALGLTLGSTMWISSVDDAPEILDRAIPILQQAVDLGPDSYYAYTMLATVNYASFDWISSEQYYVRAMEILPAGNVFGHYANMLMRSGRSTESLRFRNRAKTVERNPSYSPGMAMWTYAALGQIENHSEMAQYQAGYGGLPFSLIAALNAGDNETLRHELSSLTAETAAAGPLRGPILNNFSSPDRILDELTSIFGDRDVEWPSKYSDIALFAAFYGDPQLALKAMSYEATRTTVRYGTLWFPVMSKVRKLPGFKQLVSDVNLVEYWRAYGWTDHCRAVGADDFECF